MIPDQTGNVAESSGNVSPQVFLVKSPLIKTWFPPVSHHFGLTLSWHSSATFHTYEDFGEILYDSKKHFITLSISLIVLVNILNDE